MSNENKCENMDNHQAENSPSLQSEKSQISAVKTENDELKSSEPNCVGKVNQLSNEKNTGIAIKNIESESLNSILIYDSDSSSSSEMMKLNLNWQMRNGSSSSSSSSSRDDDEDEENDDDSDSDSDDDEENVTVANSSQSKGAIRKDKPPPKADGEISIDDLPPVPDLSTLNINVENEMFVHMGNVLGIVDKLVTVAAIPNTPAYDLDTLLFLDNGKKPLGFVFDVLAQVTSPIYAIRFNSVDDIKNLQIQIGAKVYSAPTSKHTQYVFLQQLLKMKGSDASWLGDTEVPPEFVDYSDDENERQRRLTPVKRTHSSDNYKKFETTMNKRNLLNTKFNKYMDSYKQARLNKAKSRRPQAPQIHTGMPVFDPTIPPPNLRQQMSFYQPGAVQFLSSEYLGMYYDGNRSSGGENNNSGAASGMSQSQGFTPSFFMNNFVANLNQTNSANYFTNHAGNNHPGPSHE